MKFYNLKLRSHVEVDDKAVKKKKMTRKTKSGTDQVRYAFVAEYEGTSLHRFVNEKEYNAFDGPEVK